jgi:hypothetical protein
MERLLESIEPGELCQLLCRRIYEYFESFFGCSCPLLGRAGAESERRGRDSPPAAGAFGR